MQLVGSGGNGYAAGRQWRAAGRQGGNGYA